MAFEWISCDFLLCDPEHLKRVLLERRNHSGLRGIYREWRKVEKGGSEGRGSCILLSVSTFTWLKGLFVICIGGSDQMERSAVCHILLHLFLQIDTVAFHSLYPPSGTAAGIHYWSEIWGNNFSDITDKSFPVKCTVTFQTWWKQRFHLAHNSEQIQCNNI